MVRIGVSVNHAGNVNETGESFQHPYLTFDEVINDPSEAKQFLFLPGMRRVFSPYLE